MAITKIADVIVPELFNRYVINRTMELSAFFKSGIVVNSPEFDVLASEAARTHNMPFFEAPTRMYLQPSSVRICGEHPTFLRH